jgi:hypothetical protein
MCEDVIVLDLDLGVHDSLRNLHSVYIKGRRRETLSIVPMSLEKSVVDICQIKSTLFPR